jgi:hypothetical protein
MGKLSTASGTISLNDLRTHFGDTNSISLGDFRSGGDKVVSSLNPYSYTGAKYVNTSTEKTHWRVRTTQTATGTNGSGTVTTSEAIQVHTGAPNVSGEANAYASFTQTVGTPLSWRTYTGDYGNNARSGEYPVGNPEFHVTRGTIQSAGSYSSWQNNYGFKDAFQDSTRFKDDLYQIVFYEPSTRFQVTSNINSGVPQTGSIGMDDLYQIDNGSLWSGTINAVDSGNVYTGKGFRDDSGGSYGSVATSANVDNIEGVLESQNQATLFRCYQTYAVANVNATYIGIRAAGRTTAAGTISNTSTSNISRGRFGNAFNHTGFGYTDTTAVWTNPTNVNAYNNYDRRNLNWSSGSINNTRRDDGHSGWLLPTAGPTLLQVRAESENGNPVINSVRFTPNSSWRGKTVAIQALRTRQAGGISGFTCSGAASGDFSSLSNSTGAPIVRYVKLPSSGYITLSASGAGSYTGTNRIVQITIFDPFTLGLAKDRLLFRQVYIDGTLAFDATTDDYENDSIQIISTQNVLQHMIYINNAAVSLPTSGTFTLDLRR